MFVFLAAICDRASSCAASASSLFLINCFIFSSAWKSSLGTAKRPGLDWTQTSQDRKFPRPSKTATAVQSSVSQDFGNFKTDERLVLTGSTSLSTQNPT